MTPEEMDELDEIYQEFMPEENGSGESLKPELNAADVDFLRRHGIRF